jgi:hypothetical protein
LLCSLLAFWWSMALVRFCIGELNSERRAEHRGFFCIVSFLCLRDPVVFHYLWLEAAFAFRGAQDA